jgi:hypothetical protein
MHLNVAFRGPNYYQGAITYGDPMAGERTKMLGGWGCLPESRTRIFCNKGDGVCDGAFSISTAHMSYTSNGDIGKGVSFAAQIVNSGKLAGNTDGQCHYGISIGDMQAAICKNGGAAPAPAASSAPSGKGGKGGKGFSCPQNGGAAPKAGAPAPSPKGTASAPAVLTSPKPAAAEFE